MLFTVLASSGASSVAVQAAGSTTHATVAERGEAPQYAQHHLLFVNDHLELVVAPFDPVGLKLTGPVAVQPERGTRGANLGDSSFSVARDGALVYLPFEAATRSLAIVTRDGVVQPVPGPPRSYVFPAISPDGKRIAIAIEKGDGWDIWLGDLGGNFTPLTSDGHSGFPVWSPTGDQLAFEGFREGKWGVFIQAANGRSKAVQLTSSASSSFPTSWLADGRTLIIGEVNTQTGLLEMKALTVDHPEASRQLLPTTDASFGRASPDGRWLAFASAGSGRSEVYVTSLSAPGQIWPVSQGGGGGKDPVWARSNAELFFRRLDGRVVATTVAPNGPVPGPPRPVSLGDFAFDLSSPVAAFYDALPDGRFLVARTESDRQTIRPLVAVLNWTFALAGK